MKKILDKLMENEMWVPEKERTHLSAAINIKYFDLKNSILENNSYRAVLCAKNIFEIIMKISVIYALAMVDAYIEKDNTITEISLDEIKEQKATYNNERYDIGKRLANLLGRTLREPLAMGSWQELMKCIV